MAAPTATARVTPVGNRLTDGYTTKITFAADTDVSFWENSVTPFGVDGREKIETTTMFNTTYETFGAQALKTITDGQAEVAYDPRVLSQIIALINVATVITIRHSNGTKWAAHGYLQKFETQQVQRGQMPKANVTFVAINQDTSGTEYGPVYDSGTA